MVAISACLLGLNCRYDGKNKRDEALLKTLNCSQLVPFCPEVNILGSPRERIDLFKIEDSITAIGYETKKDYTALLQNEAKRFYESYPKIKRFYFKSKSPSCALYSAKLYDENSNLLNSNETGIFAKEIKILYKEAIFVEIY